MTTPQPGPEQIAFQDLLDAYRVRVGELEHELVLAHCRIKNRDDTIEGLMRELDEPRKKMARDLPDTPHN